MSDGIRRNPDRTVIIYHANCLDGFTAAWVAHRRYPGATLLPASYPRKLPSLDKVSGKHVVVVDFSYERADLKVLKRESASLIVIDHHERAIEKIKDLPYVLGDTTRSGALLTWEFFFPGKRVPKLVQYANDRDLWKFELPDSKAVTSALHAYPKMIPVFDSLDHLLVWDFGRLCTEGAGILIYVEQMVEDLCQNAIELEIEGNNVLGVECPYRFASECAGQLAEGRLFGVAFQTKRNGIRTYSLRTRGSGFRVDELAEKFGGGGHPNAAGFRLPINGVIDRFQVRDHLLDALGASEDKSEK